MQREQVISILRAHAAELQLEGVAHVDLFGSVARDEAGPGSDVDLVVEPVADRPITLFNIGPLQDLFARLLGCPVDIIPKKGFDRSTRLKKKAGHELLHVF